LSQQLKSTNLTKPSQNVFRLHGKDNIAIKRYVISFWNGIDLRYKLLKHPSVKISIAGIIISRVSAELRFWKQNLKSKRQAHDLFVDFSFKDEQK
jgi:hypothetical protein